MNKCNLITDLLPLYAENLLSEDSKQFVERHLAKCAECSEKLRLLKTPAAPSPQTESAPDEEREVLKKTRKRLKKHTAVVAASVCLSLIVAFCAVFFPVNGYVQKREEALQERRELLYGPYVYSGDPQITAKPAVTAAGEADETQVFSFTESEETLSFPIPGEKFVPDSERHSPQSSSWTYAIGDVFGESKTPEIMLAIEQISDYTAAMLYDRALRGWNGDSILTKEQWQKAFWDLRQKARAGDYSELAAFCFNFPLEGITVDSSEGDILLARAVRECLIYDFRLLQGRAFDYFPITGAAEGFALRCTDDRSIDIYLQGRSIKMWTVSIQFYLSEPLSPLLTDDEALTSFLEQFSLTWSAE